MGLKLTKKNLSRIILQEIRKLTELAIDGEKQVARLIINALAEEKMIELDDTDLGKYIEKLINSVDLKLVLEIMEEMEGEPTELSSDEGSAAVSVGHSF
jgi:hypothetical protein